MFLGLVGGNTPAKFFLKLVDSPGGIDQFLPTGKKGVASGTNIDGDFRFCAFGFNYIPASAANHHRTVSGMNVFFHRFVLTLLEVIVFCILCFPPFLLEINHCPNATRKRKVNINGAVGTGFDYLKSSIESQTCPGATQKRKLKFNAVAGVVMTTYKFLSVSHVRSRRRKLLSFLE